MHYELEKCPFCGGEAKLHDGHADGKSYSSVVTCKDCGASGPDAYVVETAVEKWNERASAA